VNLVAVDALPPHGTGLGAHGADRPRTPATRRRMISAQTLRVCRDGKPLPDHAV